MPAMVDTRVAASSEVCALVTPVWAEAMLALSSAIWVAEASAVWSDANCA